MERVQYLQQYEFVRSFVHPVFVGRKTKSRERAV